MWEQEISNFVFEQYIGYSGEICRKNRIEPMTIVKARYKKRRQPSTSRSFW